MLVKYDVKKNNWESYIAIDNAEWRRGIAHWV